MTKTWHAHTYSIDRRLVLDDRQAKELRDNMNAILPSKKMGLMISGCLIEDDYELPPDTLQSRCVRVIKALTQVFLRSQSSSDANREGEEKK